MLIVTAISEQEITLQDINTFEVIHVPYDKFNDFYKKHKSIYRVVFETKKGSVTSIEKYMLVQFESIEARDEYIETHALKPYDGYLEINSSDYPKLIICTGHEIYNKPEEKVDKPKNYIIRADFDCKYIYWCEKSATHVTFNIEEATRFTPNAAFTKAAVMIKKGKYNWKAQKVR